MSALLGAKWGAVAGLRAQGVGSDLTALTGARVHAGGPGKEGPAAACQVRGDAGLARGGGSAGGRSVTTVVTECTAATWAQRGQGEGRSEEPEGEISRPITPPVGRQPHPTHSPARRSGRRS